MNLYILDRTSLSDLDKFGNFPRSGDAVICFRKAQDPQMTETQKFIKMGVTVLQTTDFLDKA